MSSLITKLERGNINHTFSLLSSFLDEFQKNLISGTWRKESNNSYLENITHDFQNFYKNDLIRISKYQSIKNSSKQVKFINSLVKAISSIKLNDFDWLTKEFKIVNCKKFIKKMKDIVKALENFKNLKDNDILKSILGNTTIDNLKKPINEIEKFAESCIKKAKQITK